MSSSFAAACPMATATFRRNGRCINRRMGKVYMRQFGWSVGHPTYRGRSFVRGPRCPLIAARLCRMPDRSVVLGSV
jgi:hypothetical protein